MMAQSQNAQADFSLRKILPILLTVAAGMFLVILDSTVMNVAVPKLVQSFDTNLGTVQWVITAYTLAMSAVIPLAGWFSDRFSAKRVFILSIVLFILASVLCSFAQTPEQLIIFRIIQGLGGGMVAPIGIATVFRISPPDKRGSIMGILGIPMLLAPILGPVLSGSLIEYINWHWIFLINIPVGMIALLMALKYLPSSNPVHEMKLDVLGAFLAPIAFASLVFGVHQAGDEGMSNVWALGSLVVGAVVLLIFIWHELRQKQPLLELRTFRSPAFTHGIILGWTNQIALFGSMLLFTLYLQQAKGLSPLEAGLYVIPQAILSTIGINVGGRLFDKYGIRPVAITGITSLACALFALTRITADTSSLYIMCSFAFVGLGQGLTMMQINTHVLKSAPKELVSRVTPITASAQQIMSSFGITITTAYLTRQIRNLPVQHTIEDVGRAFGHSFWITFSFALVALVLSLFLKTSPATNSDKQTGMSRTS
ncbi:MFS transporter [Paenibacillus sp. IHB B 3415]|uniref:MDR family MFS transporter n=1 Tax=Paenibacillus sp. IHB B 3415 TaxID=867080 RepID=UPI0005742EDC|nr:MDR family MFS transporter [Paenibacillus sp. IHB B 3415]KHL96201.1 MFS transporter [Paenibacillus sp. IHB B 3415]